MKKYLLTAFLFAATELSALIWSHPQEIASTKLAEIHAFLQINEHNQGTVLWQEQDKGCVSICQQHQNYWSQPSQVMEGGPKLLDFCMNSSGTGIALYEVYEGVAAQTLLEDGSWSPLEVVFHTWDEITDAKIVINDAGLAAAVILPSKFEGSLYAITYENQSWSSVEVIGYFSIVKDMDIAIDNSGIVSCICGSYRSTQITTYNQGKWSNPIEIDQIGSKEYYRGFNIVVNDNGEKVVTIQKRNYDRDTYLLQAKIFSNGVWSSSYEVAQEPNSIYDVQVMIDSHGNALFSWESNEKIQTVSFIDDVWFHPFTLSENSYLHTTKMNEEGTAICIWVEEEEVKAATCSVEGVWSSSYSISSSLLFPLDLAIGKQGKVHVLYLNYPYYSDKQEYGSLLVQELAFRS